MRLIGLFLLGFVAAVVSYYVVRLRRMHSDLSRRITHSSRIAEDDMMSRAAKTVASLPREVVQHEADYVVLHDEADKVVRASTLPDYDEEVLLTTYLRHNFIKFARTPQAWILWLLAEKASRETFRPKWIAGLDFDTGDIVCGSYRVQYRQRSQVEIGMSLGSPGESSYIDGRLVISLHLDRIRDQASFKTQTLMWRKRNSDTRMPLERSLPRWSHELASWWLIDQGTKHLLEIRHLPNSSNAPTSKVELH